MSNHLIILALGIALGAGLTYLATALGHQVRHRADKKRVITALHQGHRTPLEIVNIEQPTGQPTLFPAALRQPTRGK